MPFDPRRDLIKAADLQRAGAVDDAITIYRRLAKAHPDRFEPQRLLAIALMQTGRPKDAVKVARRALTAAKALPSARAAAHLLMGGCLLAIGEAERALAEFDAACTFDPVPPGAHFMAGNVLASRGRYAEAIERFGRELAVDSRSVETLVSRSMALSRLGRTGEALADVGVLVDVQPWEPTHKLAKANLLLEQGRLAEAAACAAEAADLAPAWADAELARGRALFALGDLEGARTAFLRTVERAPDASEPALHLARTLRHMGRIAEARETLDPLRASSAAAPAIAAEGAELDRLAQALPQDEEAPEDIPGAPAPAAPLTDLIAEARTLRALGRWDEARERIDRCLEQAPESRPARLMRAEDDLAAGRWVDGWAGFDARDGRLPPGLDPNATPMWDGKEPCDELVVVADGDMADTLLFARLLRLAADRGMRLRVIAPPALAVLLRGVDARVPVNDEPEPLRDGAVVRWAPLGSLPRLLAPEPASWPSPPYLRARPERIARWSALRGEGPTVGIGWLPPKDPAAAADRVPVEAFRGLAGIPGLRFVSLCAAPGGEARETLVFGGRIFRPDWRPRSEDALLDLVGMLQHLDLMVCDDGVLSHLAGARGAPCVTAVPVSAGWMWGRSGDSSPFYPRHVLARQARPGAWEDVAARVEAAARRLLAIPA